MLWYIYETEEVPINFVQGSSINVEKNMEIYLII